MTPPSVAAVEAEIDRAGVSAVQFRVMGICALVLALDGYDIVSMGFALPALAEAWGVPAPALTTALVMGNAGMLVGALVSGPLGDRLGRKPVFLGNILCFGLFSVLSAFCGTPGTLTAMRFLTGLGLGGGVPLAIALCSDWSPSRHQPKLVAIMTIGVQAGTVGGGMIISRIIPEYGWQSVFIAGGVLPLLVLPFVALLLPESRQFKAGQFKAGQFKAGRGVEVVRRNPVAALFAGGLAPVTVLLWIVFVCNFLTTYLIQLWLPTILRQSGFGIADAVFATTMFSLGGGLVALVLGWPVARWGAERVLSCVLVLGLVGTVWLASGEHSYTVYLLAVLCTGAGISGSQAGMNALSGAAYPTGVRSTGSGWALGVGRIGNVAGPALGGVLLGYGLPPSSIFLCAVVPVVVTIGCMALLGRVRAGQRREGMVPSGATP